MSVQGTKTPKFLENPYLSRPIFEFVSLHDQDRCKRVSRAFRQNTEALQREKILKQFSPAVIDCVGRESVERAPIFNVHAEPLLVRREDLPEHASFFIGSAGGQAYMAAKIDFFVKGKGCCCCCALPVNRGIYLLLCPRPMPGTQDLFLVNIRGIEQFCPRDRLALQYELPIVKKMVRLLNGETLKPEDLDNREVVETEQSCCFSTRLSSRFRSCFFEARELFRDSPYLVKLA